MLAVVQTLLVRVVRALAVQLAVGIAAWDGAVRLLINGAAQLHLHRTDLDVVFEEAARRLAQQLLVGPRRRPLLARRVAFKDGLEGGVRPRALKLRLVGAQLEGFAEIVKAGGQLADGVAECDNTNAHLQERAVVAQHLYVPLPRLAHASAPRDELAQQQYGVILAAIVCEEVDAVGAPVPLDAARPPLLTQLCRHRGDAALQVFR